LVEHGGSAEWSVLKQEAAKCGISEASHHRARHELGFVAETESTFPRTTYWRITAGSR